MVDCCRHALGYSIEGVLILLGIKLSGLHATTNSVLMFHSHKPTTKVAAGTSELFRKGYQLPKLMIVLNKNETKATLP